MPSGARSAGGMPLRCGVRPRRESFSREDARELNRKLDHASNYRPAVKRRPRLLLSQLDAELKVQLEEGNVRLHPSLMLAHRLEGMITPDQNRIEWMSGCLLAIGMLARWKGVSLAVVGEKAYDELVA